MEKEKSFFGHFLTIGFGTFVNMLLGLISTPILTRMVAPEVYGEYSIFSMYGSIAVMVLCLGLDQSLVRYYYQNDSRAYKIKLLRKCICLPLVIMPIVAGLFLLLVRFNIVVYDFNYFISFLLCVYCFIEVIARFSQLTLRLEYKSKIYSKVNVMKKLFYLIFVVMLLVMNGERSVLELIYASILTSIVCLGYSIVTQKEIWNFKKISEKINLVPNKTLLYYALPFVISYGVAEIFQALDKIALNHYCSYAEVGVYSSAMNIIRIFSIIQVTFNALWAPMQVEHYTKNPEDHSFYQKGNAIITAIMFMLGISIVLFKDLLAFFLGARYREAVYILPFLIFNPIMYTVSETTVGGLVFYNKSMMQVVVSVVACLANLLGNSILVPIYGCQGAAISTGISYIVFFSMRTFLANKYYYTDFKLKKFFFITLVVGCYALYETMNRFSVVSVMLYLVCLFILVMTYRETYLYCVKFAVSKLKKLANKLS